MSELRSKREDARLKLRARFLQRRADEGPRIGDPAAKIPVGQVETQKWPVLDLGTHPAISQESWQLRIEGRVLSPCTLSWADFMSLEQVADMSDFHCVTTWSKLNMSWIGVPFWRLVELVHPKPSARYILCHGHDGYTTNLTIEAALEPDVLLVHTYDNLPLSREHGGPCRMITPKLYAWKGTKWINRIEFLDDEKKGYWEVRGYSNTADPWRDDRYSDSPAED